mgnify:FL=1
MKLKYAVRNDPQQWFSHGGNSRHPCFPPFYIRREYFDFSLIRFYNALSADEGKWAWDDSDAYSHYRIAYVTSWQGFDIDLAAEDTSMDGDNSDARVVLSVARTFRF